MPTKLMAHVVWSDVFVLLYAIPIIRSIRIFGQIPENNQDHSSIRHAFIVLMFSKRNPPQSHTCTINSIDDTYFFRVVFYDRILKRNTYKMFFFGRDEKGINISDFNGIYNLSPRTYVYLIGFYPALVNILSISLIICTTIYKQYKCIKKKNNCL